MTTRERVRSWQENHYSSFSPLVAWSAMTVSPKVLGARVLAALKPPSGAEKALVERAAARKVATPEKVVVFVDDDMEIIINNWNPDRSVQDMMPTEIADLTDYLRELKGMEPCMIG